MCQILNISREQDQSGKASRTDRVALGHRLRGIADGIQGIGRLAHVFRQVRHLGNTTGVVRDRAVSIQRHDNASQGQHGRNRDRDAEKAGD